MVPLGSIVKPGWIPYLDDSVDDPGEGIQRKNQNVEEGQAREDLQKSRRSAETPGKNPKW